MKLSQNISWVTRHAAQTDSWRTLFSKLGIFLPVSKSRWHTAQEYEFHAWELPEIWDIQQVHSSFINEESKSGFIIEASERALGMNLEDLLSDKVVIDVACGPCSVLATMTSPSKKFGVDPFPFPEWVVGRYKSLDFELFQVPLEELSMEIEDNLGVPVFIMYNALQHFGSPFKALQKLSSLSSSHTVLIIEYLDTPADRAHPQILTEKRILRILKRLKYGSTSNAKFDAYLENLVQLGDGKPAKIGAFLASK